MNNKETLERILFQRESDLFELDEVITLYDLTHTYFEGNGKGNENAKHGRSKERRSDCPLVTLALVIDGSGFIRRSEVFAGNVSELATLALMVEQIGGLASKPWRQQPVTVVVDAGIASEANIRWLQDNGYHHLVVSRQRHREFDEQAAILVKDHDGLQVRAQRIVDQSTGEVRLYCHSSARRAGPYHGLYRKS